MTVIVYDPVLREIIADTKMSYGSISPVRTNKIKSVDCPGKFKFVFAGSGISCILNYMYDRLVSKLETTKTQIFSEDLVSTLEFNALELQFMEKLREYNQVHSEVSDALLLVGVPFGESEVFYLFKVDDVGYLAAEDGNQLHVLGDISTIAAVHSAYAMDTGKSARAHIKEVLYNVGKFIPVISTMNGENKFRALNISTFEFRDVL